MTDERYLLLNRVVDGEATPEERARVEAWMAEDEPMRRLHDDLMITVGRLSLVDPAVPPPTDLKRRIMNAMPADRYARRSTWSLRSFFEWLKSALRPKPALAYATVLAVGAFVGFAVHSVLVGANQQPIESDVLGSMGMVERNAETYPLDLPDADGTVRVSAAGDEILVEVELAVHQETNMLFSFDSNSMRLRSVRPVSTEFDGRVQTSAGRIRLTFSRPVHYAVILDKTGHDSLEFSVSRDGQTLYREYF